MSAAVLETARLLMREMTPGDIDFVATMLAHPDVNHYYERRLTHAESEDWLSRQILRLQSSQKVGVVEAVADGLLPRPGRTHLEGSLERTDRHGEAVDAVGIEEEDEIRIRSGGTLIARCAETAIVAAAKKKSDDAQAALDAKLSDTEKHAERIARPSGSELARALGGESLRRGHGGYSTA